MSTTLNTADKVKEVYGGTTWVQIQGRFLLGAGGGYGVGATGGEATHVLTVNEMPSHGHSFSGSLSGNAGNVSITCANRSSYFGVAGTGDNVETGNSRSYGPALQYPVNINGTVSGTIGANGSSQAHNNMPPYEVVYIWKRTV